MEPPKIDSHYNWEDFKRPLHVDFTWGRMEKTGNEVSLLQGISLEFNFPDPENLLQTAYDDFRKFLKSGKIQENGTFKIITRKIPTELFEAFKLEITEESCKILANDTEGIRRGLISLEDEMLRAEGPFLPIKTFSRKPLIKTRISHCFFVPTKNQDNPNYYPEEYLNRLAHEGINGLWLRINFKEMCPSGLFPEHGQNSENNLKNLRNLVERFRRYGIKMYVLCNEPVAFGDSKPYMLSKKHLDKHPELKGYEFGGTTFFCTSSEKGRKYIEDCTYNIFKKIPNLGGMINISLGEHSTHCYSTFWTKSIWENSCPLCSKRKPWEVISELSSSFAKGMLRANPEAQFISWAYVGIIEDSGSSIEEKKDVLRKIALYTPKNVTFQLNFESTGKVKQLNKYRVALDYWLSYPGPSELFSDCARNAIKSGARASAKIQTSCSHELATVPFVPVPGNLYKMYKAMHEIGVTTVMQCWYFGGCPGIMNKAGGELSFAPFFDTEEDFLLNLAKLKWGGNVPGVVKAWQYFQESYSNLPVSLSFAWFGPVHNCITWPLYLTPVDKPVSPSWKFLFPLESGDRIGECICYSHTFEEVLILLEKMYMLWDEGVKILQSMEMAYRNNKGRTLDISLAKAIGKQFKSSFNIFNFYNLREKLPFKSGKEQVLMLDEMKSIVCDEIKNTVELRTLCLEDSRLGYHSEAQGFKYSPNQLIERTVKLKNLLDNDFIKLEKLIAKGEEIFPEYTGVSPSGKRYFCASNKGLSEWEKINNGSASWRAWHSAENIYFELKIKRNDWEAAKTAKSAWRHEKTFSAEIIIEPRRLWPAWHFHLYPNGETYLYDYQVDHDNNWRAETAVYNGKFLLAVFRIPLDYFKEYRNESGAMRVNVVCGNDSWIKQNPWEGRLLFGKDNSADLGWLIFNK